MSSAIHLQRSSAKGSGAPRFPLLRPLIAAALIVACLQSSHASADGGKASAIKIHFRLEARRDAERVVMTLPGHVEYSLLKQPTGATILFRKPVAFIRDASIGGLGGLSVTPHEDRLILVSSLASSVKATQTDQRLVVDVEPDARPDRSVIVPATEPPAPSPAKSSFVPGLPSPMIAVVENAKLGAQGQQSGNIETAPLKQPAAPDARQAMPAGQALPSSLDGQTVDAAAKPADGILVRCDPHTGAAVFRRGNMMWLVLDHHLPTQLAIEGEVGSGPAIYSELPLGAVVTIPIRSDAKINVRREPDGWWVGPAKMPAETTAIQLAGDTSGSFLRAASPGNVVVMADPDRGTDLLIGTVTQDHQGVQVEEHAEGYGLLPSILGVVIERLADRIEMRTTAEGFRLDEAHSDGPALRGKNWYTRTLDLPRLDDAELERRYESALATAAAAPPAARRRSRLDAAEVALALGMGREAGQLATVADQDAPARADASRSAFIKAAAAVLNGDPAAQDLLAAPELATDDESELWRAIELARRQPTNSSAAHDVARYMPLVGSYPDHLRKQLIGDAALSLVEGGDLAQAHLVQDLHGDARVDLAKALLLERLGADKEAANRLRQLSFGPDPALSDRAGRAAAEVALRSGSLGPGQAADQLEAEYLNARIAGDELSLRLRVATLRGQQGDWSRALSTLRDASQAFPQAAGDIGRVAVAVFDDMSAAGRKSAGPNEIEQMSLVEDNLDLLPPEGEQHAKMSLDLARRYRTLDLPDRSAALLIPAIAKVGPGVERASLGLELAQLRVEHADAEKALRVLQDTDAMGLQPELISSRALVAAKADVALGQPDAALAALGTLQGASADDLRASAMALKHDWGGQAAALTSLAALEIPATGPLDSTMEDRVLHLVTATAHAGDQEGLKQLAARWAPRFQAGRELDLLRVLTSEPVAPKGNLPGPAELSTQAQAVPTTRSTAPTQSGI